MSRVTYEFIERDGTTYVRLSGIVDKSFDAKAFLADAAGSRVVINLAELDSIADSGRRTFRRVLEHLTDQAEEVILWDSPADLTEQFADMPALLAQAKIASFQVPYRCSSCKRNISVRLHASTLNPDDMSASLCRGCDGTLQVQRSPGTLTDLKNHAASQSITTRLKPEIAFFEQQVAEKSPFLKVKTASDLPDAFESLEVVSSGSSESRIDELSPVRREGQTRVATEFSDRTGPLPKGNGGASLRLDPTVSESRSPRGKLRGPWSRRIASLFSPRFRPLIATAGIGFALGLLVSLFFVDDDVVPEQPILEYALSLNEGDFEQAQAILERDGETLPPILVELYRQELGRARADAADVYRRQALEAYRSKRFDEAESYAAESIAMGDPDGDMLYLLAQSLRLNGRTLDSSTHYLAFYKQHPRSDKADDAMYWHSETLARTGEHEQARRLLETIMGLNRSNMKRQAAKLLLELP